MTRKRFVKMLMGRGVSHNNANLIAARYHSICMPYAMGYADWLLGLNSVTVKSHVEAMREVLEGLADTAGIVCHSIGELSKELLRLAAK